MAALGATYLYLTFADILPGAYVGERGVSEVVYDTLLGDYAAPFWTFIVAGAIVPILLVALPWTRNTLGYGHCINARCHCNVAQAFSYGL